MKATGKTLLQQHFPDHPGSAPGVPLIARSNIHLRILLWAFMTGCITTAILVVAVSPAPGVLKLVFVLVLASCYYGLGLWAREIWRWFWWHRQLQAFNEHIRSDDEYRKRYVNFNRATMP